MTTNVIALVVLTSTSNYNIPIEAQTRPSCNSLPGTNWFITINGTSYTITHSPGKVWSPTIPLTASTHNLQSNCTLDPIPADWSFSLRSIGTFTSSGYGTPRLLCVDFNNLPCTTNGTACVPLTPEERAAESQICNRLSAGLDLLPTTPQEYRHPPVPVIFTTKNSILTHSSTLRIDKLYFERSGLEIAKYQSPTKRNEINRFDDYIYADTVDSVHKYIDFYESDSRTREYKAASILSRVHRFLQLTGFFENRESSTSMVLGAVFNSTTIGAATYTLTQMHHACKPINSTICVATIYTVPIVEAKFDLNGERAARKLQSRTALDQRYEEMSMVKIDSSVLDTDYHEFKINERLARLSGGVAVINSSYLLPQFDQYKVGKNPENIFFPRQKRLIIGPAFKKTTLATKLIGPYFRDKIEKTSNCTARPYRFWTKVPCTTSSDAIHIQATKCEFCTIKSHTDTTDTICGTLSLNCGPNAARVRGDHDCILCEECKDGSSPYSDEQIIKCAQKAAEYKYDNGNTPDMHPSQFPECVEEPTRERCSPLPYEELATQNMKLGEWPVKGITDKYNPGITAEFRVFTNIRLQSNSTNNGIQLNSSNDLNIAYVESDPQSSCSPNEYFSETENSCEPQPICGVYKTRGSSNTSAICEPLEMADFFYTILMILLGGSYGTIITMRIGMPLTRKS